MSYKYPFPEGKFTQEVVTSAQQMGAWLKPFLSMPQLNALIEGVTGEEGEYFYDVLMELGERLMLAPRTGDQREVSDPIVYFHYFAHAFDWYVLELDHASPGDNTQHQVFAWCNLGDDACAELGYLSLPEIFGEVRSLPAIHMAEMDLFWEPRPLSQCKPHHHRPATAVHHTVPSFPDIEVVVVGDNSKKAAAQPMDTSKWAVYEDPGHAWLRVPRQTLSELGIADRITHCSYQRDDMVFLEEDCDLSTFIQAGEAKGRFQWSDVKDHIRTFHNNYNSPVRKFDGYTL